MKTIKILVMAAVLTSTSIPLEAAVPSGASARLAYSTLAKLAGSWRSTSTKGWTEEASYVIGGKGSVVMEISRFVDTPKDSMMTAFYLDGERLLLTHFCEAKNQPRLHATEISEDGRRIRFTFLDATNLKSPGAGHMHDAEFHLIDDDHMTSRWSWFQDGTEKWMEEITSERVKSLTAAGKR
ncbi:MAG: hypothetical protein JJE51_01695 [Thermoanaerobaculia bacterium]|nr:hypothetical protein [Thermoanaerobaculia bacterium]